jgi:hypothetical protein
MRKKEKQTTSASLRWHVSFYKKRLFGPFKKGPRSRKRSFSAGEVYFPYMSPPKNDGDEEIGSFLKRA